MMNDISPSLRGEAAAIQQTAVQAETPLDCFASARNDGGGKRHGEARSHPVLPEGWELTRIGNEIELAYGKGLPSHVRIEGNYPVFGSNGCVGKHTEYFIEAPGIIVGRKGSVGEVVYSAKNFWPIDTTYYVLNKKNHGWRFLFYLLQTLGLKKLNTHSAVPGLNREDAYKIEVFFPPQEVQEKISFTLDLITEAIRIECECIANAQDLKRAAMREVFTRGLRGEAQKQTEIGLVPESWTLQKVVKTVRPFKFERGKQLPTTAYQDTGKYPIIDQGQSDVAGYTDNDDCVIKPNIPLVIFGDHTRSLKYVDFPFALGADGTKPLVALDGLNPKFLFYAFANLDIPSRGYNRHYKILAEKIIAFPVLQEEQTQIVTLLSAIDDKITLHKRKKAALEALFTSLLHQLMTGKIRVGDLDLSALNTPQTEEA